MTVLLRLIKDILSGVERGLPRVRPTLANEVTVTGAAGAWAVGSYAELVAASVITSRFVITAVNVEAITGNHQIDLATGAAASEVVIGTLRVVGVGRYPIRTAVQAANARVAARTASKAGTSQTCALSFEYVLSEV